MTFFDQLFTSNQNFRTFNQQVKPIISKGHSKAVFWIFHQIFFLAFNSRNNTMLWVLNLFSRSSSTKLWKLLTVLGDVEHVRIGLKTIKNFCWKKSFHRNFWPKFDYSHGSNMRKFHCTPTLSVKKKIFETFFQKSASTVFSSLIWRTD